jgi:hypothetical protein
VQKSFLTIPFGELYFVVDLPYADGKNSYKIIIVAFSIYRIGGVFRHKNRGIVLSKSLPQIQNNIHRLLSLPATPCEINGQDDITNPACRWVCGMTNYFPAFLG